MTVCCAGFSKKGQIKIQQMAFVLVAFVILFAMAGLFYFSFSLGNLREKVSELEDREALEVVRKISGAPEFAFTSRGDCSNCVDFDKVLLLNEDGAYKNFWNLNFLMIEKIYPAEDDVECSRANYPNCRYLVLVNETSDEISTRVSFVSLVWWDEVIKDFRYELGRIHASGRNLYG